jgi:PhoPQ-activated pathogenicity-related protein
VERIAQQKPLPRLRWAEAAPLQAAVVSDETPTRVRVWHAESPSRDFRSARWRSVEARRQGDRFAADVPAPVEGFVSFFAEAEYPAGASSFMASTPVRITSSRQAVEPRK